MPPTWIERIRETQKRPHILGFLLLTLDNFFADRGPIDDDRGKLHLILSSNFHRLIALLQVIQLETFLFAFLDIYRDKKANFDLKQTIVAIRNVLL